MKPVTPIVIFLVASAALSVCGMIYCIIHKL